MPKRQLDKVRPDLSAGYKDGPPDRAWIDERLAEIGLLKRDVAGALGVHPNIVHKMLNGERRVQIEEYRLLAKLLRIPIATCVAKMGFEMPSATCDLIGHIDGRGRISIRPPHADGRRVPCPEGVEGIVALTINSAHSGLSVYHGSVVYYAPSDTVRVDAFGRLAVLEMDGEPAPVIGVLDRASMGQADVTIFGGIEVIQTQRLVSATPILWQRFG